MWTPVIYFDFAQMAADQRKKRVKPSSLVGCRSRDQYRLKRKRWELLQPDKNMKPNISLEWDNKKKGVVSKREQIGISRRELLPFIEPSPYGHKMLADVCSVPQEIYELENLSEVLSYEVWHSRLSEKERSYLSQFLPEEVEPDTAVRDLLAGNNLHFGNLFAKWSASLRSGELHPDNVLLEEQSLKVCKKAYHSDLQKYHNDMIVNLQTWKEKWVSCSDPEVDILQNIWRSRKYAEKTLPPSETQFYDTAENLAATPESCSWTNSENTYGSDNQHAGMVHGKSQRRKSIQHKISYNSSTGIKVAAIPKKGEKPLKIDVAHGKGANYMSYIKVSKELHGRVKSSMKQGGDSIQPRSLNNLLGGIDALNVQPFERFEEEEKKKLHDYWLKLANKDISEGFATWRKRQLLRQQVIQSLGDEIEQREKSKAVNNEEEGSKDDLMDLLDECAEEIPHTNSVKGVEKVQSDDLLQEQMDNEEHEKERTTNYNIFEEHTYNDTEMFEEEDDVPGNVLVHDHNQQQIASLTGNPQILKEIQPHGNSASAKADGHLNPVDISVSYGAQLSSACDVWPICGSVYRSTAANDGYAPAQELSVGHPKFIREQPVQMHTYNDTEMVEEEDDVPGNVLVHDHNQQQIASLTGNPQILKEIQPQGNSASAKADGHLNPVDISVSHGAQLSSACDVWPICGSVYRSTAANDGYAPAQELSVGHPKFIRELPVQMLDREPNGLIKNSDKDILHGESDGMPFLDSGTNEDRNEYLQSLLKARGSFPYQHKPGNSGVHFHPGNVLMMETGQFSHRLGEPVHPLLSLDPRQKRSNDVYTHQNIQENICSVGGRYTRPLPEQLPVNIHDWASANAVRMPAPSQPHLNSQRLSQNWCTSENVARGGWPTFEGAVGVNHSLGSGSNLDQTLFSVLSECNELRPINGYDSTGSTGPFIQTGNYGGISEGIPSSSSVLPQSPNPLNYLSGHEPKINNLGWMGFSQQNSGIRESMGKSFLRSWNQ